MAKIVWARGYGRDQLDQIQARFQLTFPPDLVALLSERRPIGGPDWEDERSTRQRLGAPLEGLLFDVEKNELWWREWGPRPNRAEERAEVVQAIVAKAPRLIPIFAHRYLPSRPSEAGNPIFSVHQSDVIHYGADLADYFEREQKGWNDRPWPHPLKEIPFWSELVRRNDG